jgi:hypothetical protein
VTTIQAAPLPRLALCPNPYCGQEIRVRNNQTLFKHDWPKGPNAPILLGSDGYVITTCPNSGWRVKELLEPTFARWLWMQSKRSDGDTNEVTRLGQFEFIGCTRSPKRTPRDMEWTTAEELHGRLHLTQLARTGSPDRVPSYNGSVARRCDWMCEYVEKADRVYQQLLAEQNKLQGEK